MMNSDGRAGGAHQFNTGNVGGVKNITKYQQCTILEIIVGSNDEIMI